MKPRKLIEEASHITRVGAETERAHPDLQKDDVPDIRHLSDRQLLAHICTRHPGCMNCPIDKCRFGQEYRRRVKAGEWGQRRKRNENL